MIDVFDQLTALSERDALANEAMVMLRSLIQRGGEEQHFLRITEAGPLRATDFVDPDSRAEAVFKHVVEGRLTNTFIRMHDIGFDFSTFDLDQLAEDAIGTLQDEKSRLIVGALHDIGYKWSNTQIAGFAEALRESFTNPGNYRDQPRLAMQIVVMFPTMKLSRTEFLKLYSHLDSALGQDRWTLRFLQLVPNLLKQHGAPIPVDRHDGDLEKVIDQAKARLRANNKSGQPDTRSIGICQAAIDSGRSKAEDYSSTVSYLFSLIRQRDISSRKAGLLLARFLAANNLISKSTLSKRDRLTLTSPITGSDGAALASIYLLYIESEANDSIDVESLAQWALANITQPEAALALTALEHVNYYPRRGEVILSSYLDQLTHEEPLQAPSKGEPPFGEDLRNLTSVTPFVQALPGKARAAAKQEINSAVKRHPGDSVTVYWQQTLRGQAR